MQVHFEGVIMDDRTELEKLLSKQISDMWYAITAAGFTYIAGNVIGCHVPYLQVGVRDDVNLGGTYTQAAYDKMLNPKAMLNEALKNLKG